MLTRRQTRRLTPLLIIALIILTVRLITLAPDSPTLLALTFNYSRLKSSLSSDRDSWLRRPARFPAHLPSEVGYLIKTGYGTRHRLREQLDAFAVKGGVLGDEGRDFLVVGDFENVSQGGQENGRTGEDLGAGVVDAVGLVMGSEVGREFAEHERFGKYRGLRAAVEGGDEERAGELGRKFGWELDALKFIMGMEMSYKRMPHKKWYIILDDDTFMVKESLELLLTHLDPMKPQYIGNAVGDYKARFAHGGSGVIISGEAMKLLFNRPDIVKDAYVRSLDETWGDRLVATTLQKVGVYLDERYSHYFNGEAPGLTRIRTDRVCSPIVSFHGLRTPGAMVRAARALGRMKKPVLWGELWDLFGGYSLESVGTRYGKGGDHVGPGEEGIKVWKGVGTVEECSGKCKGKCLAWTYDAEMHVCRVSPWLVVGSQDGEGKISGVNWSRAKSAFQKCSLLS